MKKYNHKKDFTKLEKDTAILLKLIADELQKRSTAYHAEAIHGGHVGTIMGIRHQLKGVLASMMYKRDSTEEEVHAEIEQLIKKTK